MVEWAARKGMKGTMPNDANERPREVRTPSPDCALLSNDGRYTSFSFGGTTIRFLTSPRLVRYETVKKPYLERTFISDHFPIEAGLVF